MTDIIVGNMLLLRSKVTFPGSKRQTQVVQVISEGQGIFVVIPYGNTSHRVSTTVTFEEIKGVLLVEEATGVKKWICPITGDEVEEDGNTPTRGQEDNPVLKSLQHMVLAFQQGEHSALQDSALEEARAVLQANGFIV